MDKMEKVEKLRERANVSYEEAKDALEANNWDLLDAMVALEKAGRTTAPGQQQYSTSYDQQKEYVQVKEKVKPQKESRLGNTIGDVCRNILRICRDNAFCVTRHNEEILRLPLLAFVILLFLSWSISVPAMLIALLFDCRYSLEGKDDLKDANAFMNSVSDAAQNLKEGYMSARNKDQEANENRNQKETETANAASQPETTDTQAEQSDAAQTQQTDAVQAE